MGKRMDKYVQNDSNTVVPKRSEKNKELYKQIYNAYDEFENLVVPSNAKEIDINDLKKEISSRDEYRQAKDVESVISSRIKRIDSEEDINREEEVNEKEEVYDINELLDKAVSSNKKEASIEPTLSSGDYLKKLKLDRTKTNLEQVKEMYSNMEDDIDNNDELIKTASLSLEILSDLKGTDDNTAVSAVNPDEIDDIVANDDILMKLKEKDDSSSKKEEDDDADYDFYSNNYKFSKKDFDGKKEDNIDKRIIKKEEHEEEDDEEDDDEYTEEGHSFLKIFLLIFGILLVVAIAVYLVIYFGTN